MSESALPPPHPTISIVKMLVLAWFLLKSADERKRVVEVLRVVSKVFAGPTRNWPLDFGRPVHETEELLVFHRSAAAWVGRLAEQLDRLNKRLPQ